MKPLKVLLAMLAGIALSGAMMPAAHALTNSPQAENQWGEPAPPPGDWSEVWHRGFHAGARAAHHDIEAGRRPDPNRHKDFRRPDDVRRDQRRDFREGFRHGYRMVYDRDWHHGH
jgi:hypothetical protein